MQADKNSRSGNAPGGRKASADNARASRASQASSDPATTQPPAARAES